MSSGNPAALPNGNAQPVTVLNVSNAVKVVAGELHMCALTQDDQVRCWGEFTLAVGSGSAEGSVTPVIVPLPGPAIDIGAGSSTSCALLADGRTFCWGSYAPTVASASPTLVRFP